MQLVKGWYDICLETYDSCNERRFSSYMPTRLLDLSTSSTDRIRVIGTTIENLKAPYVTLSHRWGLGPNIRLVKDNMLQLKNGITISELPKTFQDAIEVATGLGCSYLWIDSLCI
jgi:hypothetical protein